MALDVSIAPLQITLGDYSKHSLIFTAPRQPLTKES